jgi:hypothetical protein
LLTDAAAHALLRFPRNRNPTKAVRQITTTGKSAESLSSPSHKNILLNLSGKSMV